MFQAQVNCCARRLSSLISQYHPLQNNNKLCPIHRYSTNNNRALPFKSSFLPSPITNRIIIIDTETTGLSSSDTVIEIGAIEIMNGKKTGNMFNCLLSNPVPIEKKAFESYVCTIFLPYPKNKQIKSTCN